METYSEAEKAAQRGPDQSPRSRQGVYIIHVRRSGPVESRRACSPHRYVWPLVRQVGCSMAVGFEAGLVGYEKILLVDVEKGDHRDARLELVATLEEGDLNDE